MMDTTTSRSEIIRSAGLTVKGSDIELLANQIVECFKKYKAWQDETLGTGYPVRMATWNIRLSLEREHNHKISCVEIRKAMKGIDVINLDDGHSRRGNCVWRYLP